MWYSLVRLARRVSEHTEREAQVVVVGRRDGRDRNPNDHLSRRTHVSISLASRLYLFWTRLHIHWLVLKVAFIYMYMYKHVCTPHHDSCQ